MPDRSRQSRPRDPNQLAKLMIDIATGQVEDKPNPRPGNSAKDPAAVSLGRRGGLKGGKARAAAMTPEPRAEIALKAAAPNILDFLLGMCDLTSVVGRLKGWECRKSSAFGKFSNSI